MAISVTSNPDQVVLFYDKNSLHNEAFYFGLAAASHSKSHTISSDCSNDVDQVEGTSLLVLVPLGSNFNIEVLDSNLGDSSSSTLQLGQAEAFVRIQEAKGSINIVTTSNSLNEVRTFDRTGITLLHTRSVDGAYGLSVKQNSETKAVIGISKVSQ